MAHMLRALFGVVLWGVVATGCGSGRAQRHHDGGGSGPGQPGSPGAFGGCFESDSTNMYRTASMCLGPPELPPGRFWLETMEAVPDATFRNRCEGSEARDGWDNAVAESFQNFPLRAPRSPRPCVSRSLLHALSLIHISEPTRPY